jgi:hypothetical protein
MQVQSTSTCTKVWEEKQGAWKKWHEGFEYAVYLEIKQENPEIRGFYDELYLNSLFVYFNDVDVLHRYTKFRSLFFDHAFF